MRKASKTLFDLNRVSGEAEFAYWNNQPLSVVNYGMQVYVHFRFSVWWFYCGRPNSCVGGFPGVSEFNLARIALGLTMPTIFARTAPLKK